jgi:hypothetical protein
MSWSSYTIYYTGDEDYFRFTAVEATHVCDPIFFPDQDYQIRVTLIPPQGDDCRDYDLGLYTDGCEYLAGSAPAGCADNVINYIWDGACGANDDETFRIRIYGYSGAWECAPYELRIDMWQL